MMNIETIQFGRKNKKTKEQLMIECNIEREEDFNEQLAELKKRYVILTHDRGYYRPTNKIEYEQFILKLNKTKKTLNDKITLAYKEMSQRGYN